MPAVKTTFISPNKLYGDKEVVGYVDGGLAVHKVGKSGWTVSQVSSGMRIKGTAVYHTKAAALERMVKLLALDVKWALPFEEMRHAIAANSDYIRAILS